MAKSVDSVWPWPLQKYPFRGLVAWLALGPWPLQKYPRHRITFARFFLADFRGLVVWLAVAVAVAAVWLGWPLGLGRGLYRNIRSSSPWPLHLYPFGTSAGILASGCCCICTV